MGKIVSTATREKKVQGILRELMIDENRTNPIKLVGSDGRSVRFLGSAIKVLPSVTFIEISEETSDALVVF